MKAEGEEACQAHCSNSQQRSTHECQVAGIETIYDLHTLPVINAWYSSAVIFFLSPRGFQLDRMT